MTMYGDAVASWKTPNGGVSGSLPGDYLSVRGFMRTIARILAICVLSDMVMSFTV